MMTTSELQSPESFDDIYAIWSAVDSNENAGAKRIGVYSKVAQYFGKSDAGRFVYYLILDSSPNSFTEIAVIKQSIEPRKDGRFIFRLELAQDEFKDEFFRLTTEMAFEGQFGVSENTCVENARGVFENWVSFFRRSRKLTDETARGIFAELSFLEKIIEMGCSPLAAVEAWVGPFDAPQDFVFTNGSAAEIKSTRPASNTIRISSEHQLDYMGLLTLGVFELETLGTDTSPGKTLRRLTEEIRKQLVAGPAVERFNERLSATGLDTDSTDGDRAFKVHSFSAFAAGDQSFPAIRKSNLDGRISKVNYSISVNAISDFEFEFSDQWT